MQRILIHIKSNLFVKCAHLHPGYAVNLVARSRYYHCHWTLLMQLPIVFQADSSSDSDGYEEFPEGTTIKTVI